MPKPQGDANIKASLGGTLNSMPQQLHGSLFGQTREQILQAEIKKLQLEETEIDQEIHAVLNDKGYEEVKMEAQDALQRWTQRVEEIEPQLFNEGFPAVMDIYLTEQFHAFHRMHRVRDARLQQAYEVQDLSGKKADIARKLAEHTKELNDIQQVAQDEPSPCPSEFEDDGHTLPPWELRMLMRVHQTLKEQIQTRSAGKACYQEQCKLLQDQLHDVETQLQELESKMQADLALQTHEFASNAAFGKMSKSQKKRARKKALNIEGRGLALDAINEQRQNYVDERARLRSDLAGLQETRRQQGLLLGSLIRRCKQTAAQIEAFHARTSYQWAVA